MATFLFDSTIFGPVKSRRLGISLGVNLLPSNSKLCNYNCIYCECGLNLKASSTAVLPTRKQVREMLENKLAEMMLAGEALDVITFAGNGEPSLHPEFGAIVVETAFLKQAYFPTAKIAVLTNGTMLNKKDVAEALHKVDMNIIKIDSAVDETYITINQPSGNFSVEDIVKKIKKFNGKFILQTMFIHGKFNGIDVDNTTEYEVEKWIELIRQIKPESVMVYTIDREPAVKEIKKVSLAKLQEIAAQVKNLGIKVSIAD
jgi:wyosine [tRNA(Phe)-imidazoG37] synthetase (radical SAM superfamily)